MILAMRAHRGGNVGRFALFGAGTYRGLVAPGAHSTQPAWPAIVEQDRMFNLTFSFAAALWALPLAGVPVLLHLLFKQKSPVVQFSTLRFIKLSVQRTAARRRVQKWLLLACRSLLVALLIWAVAGPALKPLMGNTGGSARSVSAAIVVDTSYSMMLKDGEVTRLSKADSMVQDLLRDQLAGAKVALFTSKPMGTGQTERARDASAILAQWSPLQPQASLRPLSDRIKSAVDYLGRQSAEEKWLVVISDFQAREFPQTIPELPDGRTILLDLHVADPHSAGITAITIDPAQPIPGIPSYANVQITGQPSDAPTVVLQIEDVDGNPISQSTPSTVTLDSSGKVTKQFPVRLPAKRWLQLTAQFTAGDSMDWDNRRTRLVEVPPKQLVGVMQIPGSTRSASERVLMLALDPSEGKLSEWPLAVSKVTTPGSKDDDIVVAMAHWPDALTATALKNFASLGHTVILFLSPGLERSWPGLPQSEQDALSALLPSPPIQRPGSSISRVAVADSRDPILQGLLDEKFQLNAIVVRQLVPLAASGNAWTILNAVPADPGPGSRVQGLLFRKQVGRGVCFTCATLPDAQFTNLATHPTFLPLLVRMALKSPEQAMGQNVELGQPLVLDGSTFPGESELEILDPGKAPYRVKIAAGEGGRQFVFDGADKPGLYQWRHVNNPEVIAIANVQLPAAESDLIYHPAQSVAPPGPNTVLASSIGELQAKMANLAAPKPQWALPLSIVMLLLCLEALMGSWPKLWQPNALRAFLPGMKSDAPAAVSV
jgi:hypothetical protein